MFDTDDYADKAPWARSPWSDALGNPQRTEILREALQVLVGVARNERPDRFAGITALGTRPIYTLDATYQDEPSHYQPCYPHEGGTDNPKKIS